ncbi:MAG TPA: hypothetical protein DEO33_03595 [Rikenellaceae bacterium]|nr:hypothetical protein [Rikenellaceae bacterium]
MKAKIWNQKKKYWAKVEVIKNLTFKSAPGFKFFLHKGYKEPGFVVSEETSGARVCWSQTSKTAAIKAARERLKSVSLEELIKAVNVAINSH